MKSLTPLTLPADPSSSMHASTKQYVDTAAQPYLPVANGTHFNGNGGAASTSLIQTRCRQVRKLLRVIAGGATQLQIEWANIWTSNTPQSGNATCEMNGPNAVTARMAIEYPAGNPRLTSGSTAWSSATAYALLDQVTSGGSSWVCIQANTNQTPASNSAYWRLVRRYVVNWAAQTDTSGTVTFNPGDYLKSTPVALLERMRQGDCIAFLGAFDSGASSGTYIPYAGASGACNTAPFVDWVVDASGGLPAVGSSIVDTGITNQTNGNTTTANSTTASSWMQIPFATAICGNIPIRRCVALFGDSLMQGSGGDIRDGEPCGIFPRSVDGTSWWRIAQGGNRAGCYVPDNAPWQMSVVARCTSVVTNLAMNDINANLTFSQVQSNMKTLWTMLAATGVPVYAGFPTPISASSDSWATTTNQSRYTNGGVVNTTQNPNDDASYLTSVYGQIAMWLSQSGASITTPDNQTVQVGQQNHPLDGLLDWRQLMADPQTSWKWAAGYTSDGAHPTSTAAIVQAAYSSSIFDPLKMSRQQMSAGPLYNPGGETAVRSMSRALVKDLAAQASGSLLCVGDVSPGRLYYGFRLFAGTAAGSRTYSVLIGADPTKMKVLTSGTITTTASTLADTALTGAPIWVPTGYLMAVVVTSPAGSSWYGSNAANANLNKSGFGHVMGGNSTDTAALSGTVSIFANTAGAAAFAPNVFRGWVEFY